MQVRRVALKSRTYVNRKCQICNLSAKGGDVIIDGTGGGWYANFIHRPCMEELLAAWDEKDAESSEHNVAKGLSRKEMKARRLEEEFEILRLKILKNETLKVAEETKMCMAQLERTDTVRCSMPSGHSGPHNPPIMYG